MSAESPEISFIIHGIHAQRVCSGKARVIAIVSYDFERNGLIWQFPDGLEPEEAAALLGNFNIEIGGTKYE